MDKSSSPLEFLQAAETDSKLGQRVLKAVERGGRTTAEEVMEIAAEFGYTFSRREFEAAARSASEAKFSERSAALKPKPKPKPKPPESSCAKGCLSYSVNYCPEFE
jgi:hypothetical protein